MERCRISNNFLNILLDMLRGRVSIISSGIMDSRLVPHLVSYRRPGTAYE
jgi:hypothetical protein